MFARKRATDEDLFIMMRLGAFLLSSGLILIPSSAIIAPQTDKKLL